MQSQAVKEEARFVEDGIKNGNIAASGVNTVPTIAKEEQIIAQPAFLALMNMVESKPPPTARAGRSQSTGYFAKLANHAPSCISTVLLSGFGSIAGSTGEVIT